MDGGEISEVKNKSKRILLFKKFKRIRRTAKRDAKHEKKRLIKEKGPDAIPIQIPRTIERSREYDETVIQTNEDEELQVEESTDPYAAYYRKGKRPKVLITSTERPHKKLKGFMGDLKHVIPNCHIRSRHNVPLKTFADKAAKAGFTDLIVLNEDNSRPNSLLLCHLPEGPTAFFRISNVKNLVGLNKNRSDITKLRPEVLLNHFTTRLGRSVSRILGALFNHSPQFSGRRVCTFHNQRDYIFFRHHVYEFETDKKVNLISMGPEFTLKLKWIKQGVLDGDFEWVYKRKEQETSRSKFML